MIFQFQTIVFKLFSMSFWKKPKVHKNLIIDKAGADDLYSSGIIEQHETYVVDLDNFSWLNIYVLIYALGKRPSLLFENKFSFIMTTYIDFIKPKYVITWMDYITSFYRLKNYSKDPIYISIQSGRRSIEPGQFFDELQMNQYKNLSCDYVFCFGIEHVREYSKYIECKAIPSGSVRSNITPIESEELEKKEILFISQYRSIKNDPFITYSADPISWDIFYQVDRLLIEFLSYFCRTNNIKLNILSAIASAEDEEKEFYGSLVGDLDYNFIKHQDGTTGYKTVDGFRYIVGVNSTLLYEALARNKRTVFFDARGEYCGIPFDTFGWPMTLKKKGDFWTNEINQDEFSRLMSFLIDSTDDQWLQSNDKITPYLMNFDNDNTMLRRVLD
jgi:surface carbohydrate biosynthesis protein